MTLRRDFLAFTTGAIAARTVLPAMAQAAEPRDVARLSDPHPDAEILALAAAFIAGEREREQIDEPSHHVVRYVFPPDVAARRKVLTAQFFDLRTRIAETTAVTLEGYQAKARVLMMWLAPTGAGEHPPHDDDEYLVWSLCRDLLEWDVIPADGEART